MKVSLCGPHSFETSTLPLAVVEVVLDALASPPLSRMNSYLLHQVESWELFWADTFAGSGDKQKLKAINPKSPSIAKRRFFVMSTLLLIRRAKFVWTS